MPKKEQDFGTLLAAGLLGVGTGLAAAAALKASHETRRARFRQELGSRVQRSGYQLAQASLGLSPRGNHVWSLLLEVPMQYIPLRLALPKGMNPYSIEAMNLLENHVSSGV